MQNSEGQCIVSLDSNITSTSQNEIFCGDKHLYPTTNGICIKSDCSNGKPYTFSVEISKPFLNVRSNEKCLALMSERFRPFVTISCIGTSDSDGNIISTSILKYQKISDRKYTINIYPSSALGKHLLIELNLYEPKLFQDTTVESKNPKTNNAFGSTAFIGTTKDFGEEWLYTRPDFSKMIELNDKKIIQASMHLPILNSTTIEFVASTVSARFCSFGSNWNNKISEKENLPNIKTTSHYIHLDLMPIFSETNGRFSKSEGFILKPKKRNLGFSVIPTGDSCFKPQILEINYK